MLKIVLALIAVVLVLRMIQKSGIDLAPIGRGIGQVFSGVGSMFQNRIVVGAVAAALLIGVLWYFFKDTTFPSVPPALLAAGIVVTAAAVWGCRHSGTGSKWITRIVTVAALAVVGYYGINYMQYGDEALEIIEKERKERALLAKSAPPAATSAPAAPSAGASRAPQTQNTRITEHQVRWTQETDETGRRLSEVVGPIPCPVAFMEDLEVVYSLQKRTWKKRAPGSSPDMYYFRYVETGSVPEPMYWLHCK